MGRWRQNPELRHVSACGRVFVEGCRFSDLQKGRLPINLGFGVSVCRALWLFSEWVLRLFEKSCLKDGIVTMCHIFGKVGKGNVCFLLFLNNFFLQGYDIFKIL